MDDFKSFQFIGVHLILTFFNQLKSCSLESKDEKVPPYILLQNNLLDNIYRLQKIQKQAWVN
jgi:hypothetical protein